MAEEDKREEIKDEPNADEPSSNSDKATESGGSIDLDIDVMESYNEEEESIAASDEQEIDMDGFGDTSDEEYEEEEEDMDETDKEANDEEESLASEDVYRKINKYVMVVDNYYRKFKNNEHFDLKRLKGAVMYLRFIRTRPLEQEVLDKIDAALDKADIILKAKGETSTKKKSKESKSTAGSQLKAEIKRLKKSSSGSKSKGSGLVVIGKMSDLPVSSNRPHNIVDLRQVSSINKLTPTGKQAKQPTAEKLTLSSEQKAIALAKRVETPTGQEVKTTTLIYELYDMLAEDLYGKDYRKLTKKEQNELKKIVRKEGYIQRIYSEVLNNQTTEPNSLTKMLLDRIAARVSAYKEEGILSVPAAMPQPQAPQPTATANGQQAEANGSGQDTIEAAVKEEKEDIISILLPRENREVGGSSGVSVGAGPKDEGLSSIIIVGASRGQPQALPEPPLLPKPQTQGRKRKRKEGSDMPLLPKGKAQKGFEMPFKVVSGKKRSNTLPLLSKARKKASKPPIKVTSKKASRLPLIGSSTPKANGQLPLAPKPRKKAKRKG